MMKNKWKLWMSVVVILLPVLFGLIFWERLPEQMPTHWGLDGTVNGWSSRTFAVVGLPLILLFIHLFCIICTAKDHRNKAQNYKILGIVFWICPAMSCFIGIMTYSAALGRELHTNAAVMAVSGLLFIAVGNYLPKCRQNRTIGIKIKWTLENEENWNATHRICGKIWVLGGILMICCTWIPTPWTSWVLTVILSVLVILPILYSGWYHFYRG